MGGLRHARPRRLRAARDGALGRRRASPRRSHVARRHRRRPRARRRRRSAGSTLASARAASAWDLAGLAADYRRFLLRFGSVIDRFRAGRQGRARSRAGVHRAHAADPRLPPRAAARSAAAGRAAAARLARRRGVRALPRLLSAHPPRGRTAPAGDARRTPAGACRRRPPTSIAASAGLADEFSDRVRP